MHPKLFLRYCQSSIVPIGRVSHTRIYYIATVAIWSFDVNLNKVEKIDKKLILRGGFQRTKPNMYPGNDLCVFRVGI